MFNPYSIIGLFTNLHHHSMFLSFAIEKLPHRLMELLARVFREGKPRASAAEVSAVLDELLKPQGAHSISFSSADVIAISHWDKTGCKR